MIRIQTKLILAILFVSLLPVLPLYFVVNDFFKKSLEVGFNAKVEQALENATQLSRRLLSEYKQQTLRQAEMVAERFGARGNDWSMTGALAGALPDSLPMRVQLYDRKGTLVFERATESASFPSLFMNRIHPLLQEARPQIIDHPQQPQFISAAVPLRNGAGLLVLTRGLDAGFTSRFQQIVDVNQMFKTLGFFREDLQRSFLMAFFVIYIPISLISIGLGIALSRRISRPIRELAAATQEVAAGNWEHRVSVSSRDELGQLAESFNLMVQNLHEKQQQVIALEKMAMWREMARVLAHEIKNPLTPIQLTIQQLRDKYAGDDESYRRLLQECSAIINDEIKSLQNLVRAFSEFARMPELQRLDGDLNELIHDIIRLYPDANIQMQLGANVPRFRFDPDQLRRVLINLIENALQSLEKKGGGAIRITTRMADDQVLLWIEDTGTGIPEDIRAKIWEPYFSTKKHGMGLGLAIVRRIIEEHGGHIAVDSQPGEWTRFEIRLPVTG
ncbi:MAG: ATP-binding protein [candidate division KSB1 bacterium]|nr:ATP-binding protein [candidate division KSB1 bacterium]